MVDIVFAFWSTKSMVSWKCFTTVITLDIKFTNLIKKLVTQIGSSLSPLTDKKLEALTALELRNVMKKHFKHVCKVIFRHKSILFHPQILKKYGLKIKMVRKFLDSFYGHLSFK